MCRNLSNYLRLTFANSCQLGQFLFQRKQWSKQVTNLFHALQGLV